MEKGQFRVAGAGPGGPRARSSRIRSRILLTAALSALVTLAACGTKGPLTLTPQPKRACADGSPPPCPIRPAPDLSGSSNSGAVSPSSR
ncbi:MAG: LPS translocon maturation chaperone LptM [Betaproteobacteria bacterium]